MHVREVLAVSERRACRVLDQVRRTQRYTSRQGEDEVLLTTNIVSLASHYGRYGYRRITAMLRADGWGVNHKRVERIWRQEGLKVPARQPKRGRLWLNDGSRIARTGPTLQTPYHLHRPKFPPRPGMHPFNFHWVTSDGFVYAPPPDYYLFVSPIDESSRSRPKMVFPLFCEIQTD